MDSCHCVCVCKFYIQEVFEFFFFDVQVLRRPAKELSPYQVFPLGSVLLTTTLQLVHSQFWCCYESKSFSSNLQSQSQRESKSCPKVLNKILVGRDMIWAATVFLTSAR